MRRFRAILAQDGVETAEGFVIRDFPLGCFTWVPEELPLPLRGVVEDVGGHQGAFPVGVMQQMERQGAWVVATGFLDDEGVGADADRRRDLIRQIELGVINKLSVDPGNGGVEVDETCEREDADGWCEQIRVTFTRYSIGGATLVAIPALQGTLIELLDDVTDDVTAADALDAIAASAVAVSLPMAGWFDDPELAELTRVPVVTEDGRVYGHLAGWTDCHLNFADYCQTPWRSQAAYGYFHTCSVETDDGPRDVGVLSVTGGHFPTVGASARDWQAAQAHYDDPSTVAAYVRVGEDEHGIWFSGALRQGVTPEQVALFRQHQLSGDWRRIDGHMELIAGCSVNVPGFVRSVAVAASASGEPEPFAAVVAGVRQRATAAAPEHACSCGGASTASIDLPALRFTGGLSDDDRATLRRIQTALEPTIRAQLQDRMRDTRRARV